MNPLYNIIKIFILNNNIYNKYHSILNIKYIKESYQEVYKILRVLTLFKETHQDSTVSDFSLYFFSSFPAMKPDEIEVFMSIFQRIKETDASEQSITDYLEAYKVKETSTRIALKAIEVAEGKADYQDILAITQESGLVLPEQEDLFVTDDLQEIYEQTLGSPGLRWRLDTLNKMLGSLRQGNFGFVFARPETGKTTFLASEVSHMATQTDGNILWINNEEDGRVVKSRCYQAALGLTLGQLHAHIEDNRSEYTRLTGGRIKILDDANASQKSIDTVCRQLEPRLIIIDQIDKVRGFENDRYDLKMKEIYQWARELSKRYGPTIGTCQAGGTGDNKKWLQMNDVDSSHTAKQGEADFILGIGKVNDDNYASERYLCLSKNKLPGDKDTLPALRHGKCPVTIRSEIARYEDKMHWDK